uniref:Uncharacterized protein n=1 Tax=viral metagenome TaxID=1070528 RepID=A0A6C0C3H5_9ZZZZ
MDYQQDSDSDIDITRLEEIEKEDEPYDGFYPEEIDIINIFFVYVDKFNKIIFIKNDNILIENSCLSKLDLSVILKKNRKHNNIIYTPLSILKYNIDLDPNEVNGYLKYTDDYNFLTVEKNIQNIKWNDSIALFKDLNSLHVIFYESVKKNKKNQTKRIKLINNLKSKYTRKK